MTGQAIGEVLAFGVGAALTPLAIVAIVVMLAAPGGTGPAWAFAGCWVLTLTLACTLVVLLADGAEVSMSEALVPWVGVTKIVVGLLLLLFAVRQWRRRGRSKAQAEAPEWLRRLDRTTAARAAGLAALINLLKPKNLLLTIGAGVAVAQVGAAPAAQAVAVAVYVVLGSVGIATPLAIHVLMPHRGRHLLIGLRDWMVQEQPTIIAVLCLALAAMLLGDALTSLAG
jgi:hypothetical protein